MSGNIRLLICNVCNTIEELEDFDGPPELDTLLDNLASRHAFPSGERHVGNLVSVPLDYWGKKEVRREIIRQIREGSGGISELDSRFYETRDTFKDDALTCWKRHNRTTNCGDYRHPSKRLIPDTENDWRNAGISRPKSNPALDRYLCDFCPYHRVVVEIEKKKRGI